jgi:MFS transporter, BCD family, chlorophyll transporter
MASKQAGLGWPQIVRLGLVQSAIGALVMMATSLLNRIMVVEYAMAAAIPAGLVAWHYAVQLSRPLWGHGSDKGQTRTPWIIGGMATLALGNILAVDATILMDRWPVAATTLAAVAYGLIGAGVGAAGTSLLALLASQVAPQRRPGAAALTWILMIVGIVAAAGTVGSLLDPFSPRRLATVACFTAAAAFVVALLAVWKVERPELNATTTAAPADFAQALRDVRDDPEARRFTVFIFVSMLAYSMQDMILEPFAGLSFGFTPGDSTKLSGVQHMGVLVGMILVGVGAGAFGGGTARGLRQWTVAGCIGSAVALLGLVMAARFAPDWPLRANVALLGFANGVFAVSAIGSMMALAGAAGPRREGIRMGVWGASQAIAFGLGGLTGALGVDLLRRMGDATESAFGSVFAGEAALFVVAAWLALGAVAASPKRENRRALA